MALPWTMLLKEQPPLAPFPCQAQKLPTSYPAPCPQDLAEGLGKIALIPPLVLQPWGDRLEEGNHLTAGGASSLRCGLQSSGAANVTAAVAQKTGRCSFSHFLSHCNTLQWKWVGNHVQALVLFVSLCTSSAPHSRFLSTDLAPAKQESHF